MEKRPLHYSMVWVAPLLALTATTASAAEAEAVLASARAATAVSERNYRGFITESGSEQASGLVGRWKMAIDLATGRTRESSNFGIFSTAAVWDGRHYWRQDASGGVHPINSAFMQSVKVTDAWLAARGYLRRDFLGARMETLEDQSADGRRFAVIRARPRQGQAVELWFDKQSKRLARTVQVMTTYVLTIRYDDYRQTGGGFLPFRITAEDGVGTDPDVVLIDHVDWGGSTNEDFDRPRPPDDAAIAGGHTVVPIEFDGDVSSRPSSMVRARSHSFSTPGATTF